MQTTTTTAQLTVLVASEGHLLCRDINADDPYFCERVYLGINADPSDYTEVTNAEADRITAAAKARREAANTEVTEANT